MPTLEFNGKHHIYTHHLTVPYRPLETDKTRSCNPTDADDNLIIHGDNLHALKALLPRYKNRIKCIYIDPPYNTGKEDWEYNDNVKSPLMQAWFKENSPIDNEDLERHEKWLCMMWPRLHILKDLLADDGIIFVSIDDNEVHHLRMLMDEIFREPNFVAQFFWMRTATSPFLSKTVRRKMEPLICYRKSVNEKLNLFGGYTEGGDMPLLNESNAIRQVEFPKETFCRVNLKDGIYKAQEYGRIRLVKEVEVKDEQFLSNLIMEGRFKWTQETVNSEIEDGTRFHIKSEKFSIRYERNGEQRPKAPSNLITQDECQVGTNEEADTELEEILGSDKFNYPKPTSLIKYLINMICDEGDIILDSFAGSGTTAHAVLALNKEDGGNRKFILIECEDYADTTTAERVRRVINGVPNATDEALREGLGGSFTYCTLGEPIEVEAMLTGEKLPTYTALATNLLFTSAGLSVEEVRLEQKNDDGLFYSNDKNDYYLIYKPDLEYLRSNEAILNLEHAKRIQDSSHENGKKAIVYAAGNYIGQRELTKMGIAFCQLPYSIHER